VAILPGLIWRRSELRLNPREVMVRKRGWRGGANGDLRQMRLLI
jgi:hypothetical protein